MIPVRGFEGKTVAVFGLARTGLTVGDVRAHLDAHPEMKRATYRVPHAGAVGVAANLVLHVAARTGRRAAA